MRRIDCLAVRRCWALLLAACAPASTPAPAPSRALRAQATNAPQPKATEPADGGESSRKRRNPPRHRTLKKSLRRSPMIGSAALMARKSRSSSGAISSDPYCAAVSPLLKRLADAYPKDVQTVFRHFPLPSHPLSFLAAEATEAAGAQGKFWEMEEQIFANQQTLAGQSEADFRKTLDQYRAKDRAGSSKVQQRSGFGQVQGQGAGRAGFSHAVWAWRHALPAGQRRSLDRQSRLSVYTTESLVKIVDYSRSDTARRPRCRSTQNKQYTATIKTDQGDIVVKLFADKAPLAVNNFVFLAKERLVRRRDLPSRAARLHGAGRRSHRIWRMGDPGYSIPE